MTSYNTTIDMTAVKAVRLAVETALQTEKEALERFLGCTGGSLEMARLSAEVRAAEAARYQSVKASIDARYDRLVVIRRAKRLAEEVLHQEYLWASSRS